MVNVLNLRQILVLVFILLAVPLLSGADESAPPFRTAGDLDSDGQTEEYLLVNHVLTVKEGTQELWKSPPAYHVDCFALGDIDNNGKSDLVVSLWKEGSFGEIRPFWHSGEDNSYKNHLFVYALRENTFTSVWCSSDLDRPILSLSVWDADGNGLNELVVEEGRYRKVAGERYAPDPDGSMRTAVWQWEEWGFCLNEPL
ncbi:MAG: hypothetical protein PHC91_05895 [Eubacteriales bacterium]|nr:hypothetical protein [Eubacteriales bacterium]